MTTASRLEFEALRLPAEERMALADRLIASVIGTPVHDDAWFAEVRRRVAEAERNRESLLPDAEALERARAALK